VVFKTIAVALMRCLALVLNILLFTQPAEALGLMAFALRSTALQANAVAIFTAIVVLCGVGMIAKAGS
jgi:hypothetical protein